MGRPRLTAGVDIGTHQVTVAVGQPGVTHPFEIVALRSGPTRGVARGTIVDLADCVEAIARVVRHAEEQAGSRILSAAVTIHGPAIQHRSAQASVTLSGADSEISRGDVARVLAACRTAAASYDRQILHEFVQRFAVDTQDGIRDPVGLFGGRLEAELHLVTLPTTVCQGWRKALSHAGVEVSALVLPGAATASAVLSELDRDLGVIVVDIGGAHTDIVACVDGAIRETLVVPWGGDRFTERIAERFELPLAVAEEAKLQCNAIEVAEGSEEVVRVAVGPGHRTVPRAELAALLAEETRELFTAVRRQLEASRYFREASAGLVITGGTALMQGVLELAEALCNLPARLGSVHGIACRPELTVSPTAVTAVGLVAYQMTGSPAARASVGTQAARPWGRWVERAKTLFDEYF